MNKMFLTLPLLSLSLSSYASTRSTAPTRTRDAATGSDRLRGSTPSSGDCGLLVGE